eukprot:GDKI01030493.1.p2 GENE.GDKI01030493.1~~GDKI01030493.1.p2  ORF type:complete len:124 (+),score=36.20 GDKI01030493.1:108-479(+)
MHACNRLAILLGQVKTRALHAGTPASSTTPSIHTYTCTDTMSLFACGNTPDAITHTRVLYTHTTAHGTQQHVHAWRNRARHGHDMNATLTYIHSTHCVSISNCTIKQTNKHEHSTHTHVLYFL